MSRVIIYMQRSARVVVSDANRPVETGNYDKSGQVLDIEVKGNYAYLAGESAMLKC